MSHAARPDGAVPARAIGAVRLAVRRCLTTAAAPGYRAVLRLPLQRRGRLLAGARPPWVELPLACALAAGGDWRPAVPVATAMELTASALELLDDLEDGDLAPDDPLQALSPARQLNASTGLLTLALSTLDGAAGRALAAAVLAATAGQDDDLAGEGAGYSEAACLAIARAKTAGLSSCAARLGALAGGAPAHLVESYAHFGLCLGMAGQLANDLRAADPARGHTDLLRRKPTVLLAAAGLAGPDAAPAPPAALVDRLYASGAVAYTWLLAETERQEALATLERLAGSGQAVAPLRSLVRPVAAPAGLTRPSRGGAALAAASLPPSTRGGTVH